MSSLNVKVDTPIVGVCSLAFAVLPSDDSDRGRADSNQHERFGFRYHPGRTTRGRDTRKPERKNRC